MGADVATFVVSVDGEVQTHKLDEVWVVAKAELVGKVVGIVLVLLGGDNLAALEDVLVDTGGDGGELGNEVHRILEGVAPVVLLVHTLGVGTGERGGLLESGDCHRELGHGVEVARAPVDELLDELGDLRAGSPVGRKIADLLLRRDLASQEKPEKTLRKRLLAARGLGQKLLALRDGPATEANALLGIEDGTFPHQALDAASAAVYLVEGHLVDNLRAMLPTVEAECQQAVQSTK